ncbi:MAG: hypothetical protein LBH53_00710 [Puniceicoccales bacterium]|jgi:hypothetical protein|nr:hypothetical protein [Puniceicoccales bacterium]
MNKVDLPITIYCLYWANRGIEYSDNPFFFLRETRLLEIERTLATPFGRCGALVDLCVEFGRQSEGWRESFFRKDFDREETQKVRNAVSLPLLPLNEHYDANYLTVPCFLIVAAAM